MSPPPRALSPPPRAMSPPRALSPPGTFSPPSSRPTSPLRQNSVQVGAPRRNSPAWFHTIKPLSPPSSKKHQGTKQSMSTSSTNNTCQAKKSLTPNEEVESILVSLDELSSYLPMPKTKPRPSSPPPTPPQLVAPKAQRISQKVENPGPNLVLRKKSNQENIRPPLQRPASQPIFTMSQFGAPDSQPERSSSPQQRPYSLQPRSSTPTNCLRPIETPPKRGASTHDAIRIRSESAGPIRPEPRKCISVPLFSPPSLDSSKNRLSMEYREFEDKDRRPTRQPPSNVSPQVLQIKTPRHKFEPKFEVPLWSVEDVVAWVNRAGFQEYASAFQDCGVDGDMLLQLTDQEIKDDIGISNGILRKRFIRELKDLKKNADYTSCDGGMTANFMKRLNASDLEDMLKDSGVESTIHRHKIIEAVLNPDDDSLIDSMFSKPTCDVSLSYPKNGGAELASLIKIQLEMRDFTVFCDAHDSVGMTESFISQIKDSRYFVLVMPPGALDSCLEDTTGSDRLHTEIAAALSANTKIIPVTADFQW